MKKLIILMMLFTSCREMPIDYIVTCPPAVWMDSESVKWLEANELTMPDSFKNYLEKLLKQQKKLDICNNPEYDQ